MDRFSMYLDPHRDEALTQRLQMLTEKERAEILGEAVASFLTWALDMLN